MKKKILNISTKILITTLLLITFASPTFVVNAAGYTYDFWKNVIPCADGLSLSDVFFQNNIKNFDKEDKTSVEFDTLTDLATYVKEDKKDPSKSIYEIYVLDSRKYTDTPLNTILPSLGATDKSTAKGLSAIYVLNQDFQKIEMINEFLITDEVKETLSNYYNFRYELNQIVSKQINSTELINSYKDVVKYSFTYGQIKNSSAIIDSKIDFSNLFDKVTVKIDNQEVDRKLLKGEVSSTTVDGITIEKTILSLDVSTLDFTITDESVVSIDYQEIKQYGRAPYLPYSKDATKAAIRISGASGVTRTDDGLYVADSDNARIIRANKNEEGVWVVDRVYLTPNDNVFYQVSSGIAISDNTNKTLFNPKKIAVDKTGKVFCIAQNVYEGILEYDVSGSFNRFLGKNEVTANPLKKFWAKIFSEDQLDSLALDLPPEFTNIAIDSSGFIYATSNPDADDPKAANMVKMINTAGKDVMKRNGYVTPDGDAVYVTASNEAGVILGSSQLVGVTVSENGNFTVVDKRRGRLFTYDNEGNLLYTTGDQPGGSESSSSSSNIVNPVSIKYFTRTTTNLSGEIAKEEVLLVLDQKSKSIMLYETTEFGEKVNLAINKYQNGVFENVVVDGEIVEYGAEYYWNEVLKMNENYELAHLGIGKAQYRRGDYKEAMANFKLAHNANYYSKAYAEYRDAILSANFSWIMTAVIMLVVLCLVVSYSKHVKIRNSKIAATAALNEQKYNIIVGKMHNLEAANSTEEQSTNESEEKSVEKEEQHPIDLEKQKEIQTKIKAINARYNKSIMDIQQKIALKQEIIASSRYKEHQEMNDSIEGDYLQNEVKTTEDKNELKVHLKKQKMANYQSELEELQLALKNLEDEKNKEITQYLQDEDALVLKENLNVFLTKSIDTEVESTTISENNEELLKNEENKEGKRKNIFARIPWSNIFSKIKNFFHEVIGVPLYILTHPIQGFTEFKNEKKGKMWVALTILIMYVLVEILAYQYEGIVTNKNNPQNFSSIRILIYGVLPPVILSIANWSVTTLLDGKGKMREIFMMICYSLVPIVLINLLNILLSNILTLDEAQFITLLTIVGWVLTGFMVFMGLVVIHEYGMGKTIWSIILTIVATLIIAFLALLIFDLAQQIYGFIYSLYKEITTRYF
mgnify:CR=1 FL=1